MSNRAWMPLHIGDYLADTGHLTATEHGAYLLLIMHYWQNGCLPENERIIARIAKLSPEQWEESRDMLAMLFGPGWTVGIDTSAHRTLNGRAVARKAIPLDVKRAAVDRDGYRCVYCGDENGPFDYDHRLPIARGGENTIENVCVSCRYCNRAKGILTAEEWMGVLQ